MTEQNSDSVPAVQVIRQTPAPGADVAPGSTVSLFVSTGPADTGGGGPGCQSGKGLFTFGNLGKVLGDFFLLVVSGLALTVMPCVKRGEGSSTLY